MATFSTNQARQIYVAAKQAASAPTTLGDLQVCDNNEDLYFKYLGPDTLLRSDIIKKGLITKATLTHGANIEKYLNQFEITLDAAINSGNPVAGQEYILRINFLGWVGLGIEDMRQKYGFVKATTGMTASDFYKAMAISLAKNFSNDAYPVVKVFVATSGQNPTNATLVKANTAASTLSGTYTKIIIEEASQYWHVGTDEDLFQSMNIFTDRILVDGVEMHWGFAKQVVKKATGLDANKFVAGTLTARENSVYRQLADMEYFYMGERGDKYRMLGYPRVIYTDYMIDKIGVAKNSNAFGIIDIHYSYVGDNESVQKSEKDCCIIAPIAEALKIAQAINTAGVSITYRKADGTEEAVSGSTEV